MTITCPACQRKFEEFWDEHGRLFCPTCTATFSPDEARVGVVESVVYEPGSVLGGFEIIALISRDGMNHVYKARQLSLGRLVALKLMRQREFDDDEAIRRFMQEMRHTAALEHPNIVTLYETGHAEGVCYYAMSFVDGETLDDRLHELGHPLPEEEALRYMRQIADALRYAWNKHGILHRDLKPANMMVDLADDVKLLDLGIAKRVTDNRDLVRQGIAIGTPHYMSPEQSRGSQNLDFRSDIYSLGATLYQLATGTLPFAADKVHDLLVMHNDTPLPDPRERHPALSEGCAVLIKRMMGKRRADRHRSWESLIEQIDVVLAGGVPVVEQGTIPVATTLGEQPDAEGRPAADSPGTTGTVQSDRRRSPLNDTAVPKSILEETVVLTREQSHQAAAKLLATARQNRPRPLLKQPAFLVAVALSLLVLVVILVALLLQAPEEDAPPPSPTSPSAAASSAP